MAGERLGVADIHQALYEAQRVVKSLARFETADNAESQQ